MRKILMAKRGEFKTRGRTNYFRSMALRKLYGLIKSNDKSDVKVIFSKK